MKTISAEEYTKKYGVAGVESINKARLTLKERLSSIGTNASEQIKGAIQGTGEFQGQTPIRRGVEATATAFNTVPQGALAMAPEPVREGAKFAGEKISSGFKALTDMIASNPQLQEWTQAHPEATKSILEVAGTASAGGEIAGNILAAQGTANTITKGVGVVKTAGTALSDGTQGLAQTAKEALSVTPEQIASERASKIKDSKSKICDLKAQTRRLLKTQSYARLLKVKR